MSILVRFRKRQIQTGLMQVLFDAVNQQLEEKHLILKRGALVDANIVK